MVVYAAEEYSAAIDLVLRTLLGVFNQKVVSIIVFFIDFDCFLII